MGKDKPPAFLFYSSDFLTGTMLMTNEQKGKYITLLCLQHQQGHIKPSDMASLCGRDRGVLKKFKKDEKGCYYNERLDKVIADYKGFCVKQSERANKRWGKTQAIQDTGNAGALPIENGSENTIHNPKRETEGEKRAGVLEQAMEDFITHRE